MVEGRLPTVNSRLKRSTKPGNQKKKTLQKNQIERNLNEVISSDLLAIAKTLKKSTVFSLRLFQKYAELQKRNAENKKLGFLGYRHSETLFTFSKNLAWALSTGGWLQELELGFALWERDLKIIAESISQSTTLKRLSFANSELGDHGIRILGKSLQECAQLEVLNLSACALTDASSGLLSAILKAHVCRRTQSDWQASLRSSKGINALTMRPKGLVALDISMNHLSDVSIQTICIILRIGTPLEALNLRGNQLTRMSGRLLLDVMEEWTTLRFVDLRDNVDNRLMGVLEDRQHLTTFTQRHPPFWMSSFRSRRTQSKAYSKQPKQSPNEGPLSRKTSIRPQSGPTSAQVHRQLKNRKLPLALTAGHSTHMRDDQLVKRPSTCSTKEHRFSEKNSSSSCSPEFTAWEDNDSTMKENRFPFQASGPGLVPAMLEGSMSEEEPAQKMTKRPHTAPNGKRVQQEEAILRPLESSKSRRFRENIDPRNCRPLKPKPSDTSKSRRLKQTERVLEKSSRNYDENDDGLQQKEARHKLELQSQPPKLKPSMAGGQTASFLKEITQIILHLQERLDELIGPADRDSLAEQAASHLRVLC